MKKKILPPKRKRMKRQQRLQDAKKNFLPGSTAENKARAYSNWYGVDLHCAIKELELIGYPVSEKYKEQVAVSMKDIEAQRLKKMKEAEQQRELEAYIDSIFYW
ncbi:hypothetical protein [Sporosarcina sp.]|uniref:hypothetical protein n=1 Tax=Sporosarcina sp. TaxID=49982 RepID=UPI002639A21D|nr:hypothetical protein [Sporosarcina sp.]